MGDTIIIDVWGHNIECPDENFSDLLKRLGIKWTGWEDQPMADQVKLLGCSNLPDPLPRYMRKV